MAYTMDAWVKQAVGLMDALELGQVELGRRGMVGGQEDMIEDTAMTMARERKNSNKVAA